MSKFGYALFILGLACSIATVVIVWVSPTPPDRVIMTLWVGIATIWMFIAFRYERKLKK